MNKFIAGGCSFTFGHELSDDEVGKTPSKKTWAYKLYEHSGPWSAVRNKKTGRFTRETEYLCVAHPGAGNSGIARRVFNAVTNNDTKYVVVMWSFLSRYDWAMPRHKLLENTRWASISPWDTKTGNEEAFKTIAGSEIQTALWTDRKQDFETTKVGPFAEAIYRYAANEYHETYLSWKSIIWLQNILEKKNIKYFFTLADNSLFYHDYEQHKDQDNFMKNLHNEIDFSNWYFFGERNMGFNQWASLNEYPYGTTHPLDKAHQDAVQLMLPKFNEIIGGKNV